MKKQIRKMLLLSLLAVAQPVLADELSLVSVPWKLTDLSSGMGLPSGSDVFFYNRESSGLEVHIGASGIGRWFRLQPDAVSCTSLNRVELRLGEVRVEGVSVGITLGVNEEYNPARERFSIQKTVEGKRYFKVDRSQSPFGPVHWSRKSGPTLESLAVTSTGDERKYLINGHEQYSWWDGNLQKPSCDFAIDLQVSGKRGGTITIRDIQISAEDFVQKEGGGGNEQKIETLSPVEPSMDERTEPPLGDVPHDHAEPVEPSQEETLPTPPEGAVLPEIAPPTQCDRVEEEEGSPLRFHVDTEEIHDVFNCIEKLFFPALLGEQALNNPLSQEELTSIGKQNQRASMDGDAEYNQKKMTVQNRRDEMNKRRSERRVDLVVIEQKNKINQKKQSILSELSNENQKVAATLKLGIRKLEGMIEEESILHRREGYFMTLMHSPSGTINNRSTFVDHKQRVERAILEQTIGTHVKTLTDMLYDREERLTSYSILSRTKGDIETLSQLFDSTIKRLHTSFGTSWMFGSVVRATNESSGQQQAAILQNEMQYQQVASDPDEHGVDALGRCYRHTSLDLYFCTWWLKGTEDNQKFIAELEKRGYPYIDKVSHHLAEEDLIQFNLYQENNQRYDKWLAGKLKGLQSQLVERKKLLEMYQEEDQKLAEEIKTLVANRTALKEEAEHVNLEIEELGQASATEEQNLNQLDEQSRFMRSAILQRKADDPGKTVFSLLPDAAREIDKSRRTGHISDETLNNSGYEQSSSISRSGRRYLGGRVEPFVIRGSSDAGLILLLDYQLQ